MVNKVMTSKQFINGLKTALNQKTKYDNHYPKNLGYFDGNVYSFDCWNLIKVVLSGWKPTGKVGSYIPTSKLVTGDIDGATLLKNCDVRSKDFSQLKTPGSYLYLSNSPHSGVYIGDTQLNGRLYNVIECTGAWKTHKVTLSYVAPDGGRYNYKGGEKALAWTDWGLLNYVDYSDVQPVQPVPTPVPTPAPQPAPSPAPTEQNYYIVQKNDTLDSIAKKFNTTYQELARINNIKNPNLIYPGQKIYLGETQNQSEPTQAEPVYYTVQKNDTLSSISLRFGTPIEQLKQWNNIKNINLIYTGQKLRVK